MELYSDAYYIERTLAGDTGCFACLLDRYSRPVHSLIFKMVGNREDAEELAQDVFMKVFRNLSSFKADSSFSTWIYRIAYNTAISELRKKKQEFVAIEESQINNVSEEEVSNLLGRTSSTEQLDKLEAARTGCCHCGFAADAGHGCRFFLLYGSAPYIMAGDKSVRLQLLFLYRNAFFAASVS